MWTKEMKLSGLNNIHLKKVKHSIIIFLTTYLLKHDYTG